MVYDITHNLKTLRHVTFCILYYLWVYHYVKQCMDRCIVLRFAQSDCNIIT